MKQFRGNGALSVVTLLLLTLLVHRLDQLPVFPLGVAFDRREVKFGSLNFKPGFHASQF